MNVRVFIAAWLALPASWIFSDEVHISLPDLFSGSVLVQRVAWTNSGAAPILVKKIDVSCECLKVTEYPEQIVPGQAGVFSIEILGVNPGAYEYEMKVTSDVPEESMIYRLHVAVKAMAEEQRASHWYCSVAEVMERQAQGHSSTFVDVRGSVDYARARLPGSLNMPLYEVKTKSFLKGKDIVLVDGGWGDERLELECLYLQNAGFASVKILYGGLNAWSASGQPLEGTRCHEVQSLSAAALCSVIKYGDWLAVDLTDSDDSVGIIPGAQRISWHTARDGEAAARLRDLLMANAKGKRVVLFTENGEDYDAIQDQVDGPDGVPVFFLRGGIQDYRRQLRENAALQRAGVTTVTSGSGGGRKPCGSCPSR